MGEFRRWFESPPDSLLVSGNVVLKYRQNLDLHEGARFDAAFVQLHIDARVRRSCERFARVKCNNVPFCHKTISSTKHSFLRKCLKAHLKTDREGPKTPSSWEKVDRLLHQLQVIIRLEPAHALAYH
jgi:trehalose/maltose hydrolase-like predicted phosphorylase